MRLSEDRINFIATQIGEGLLKQRRVRYKGNVNRFIAEIEKVILADIRTGSDIEREAERAIRRMQRDIPEGSAEWNAIYQQQKEEIAARKGYNL